jgi:hypothetical protein
MAHASLSGWLDTAVYTICVVVVLYLIRLNLLLKGVPSEVQKLSASPWTKELLKRTYKELSECPMDYTHQLPPKLQRRYIVTGGSGEHRRPEPLSCHVFVLRC